MMLLDEPSMGLAPLLMLSMFDALREILGLNHRL
jgi:branched-chain amino acid transport system ATP-binding protein